MGIIGVLLILISIGVAACSDEVVSKQMKTAGIMAIIAIGMIVYDSTSPTIIRMTDSYISNKIFSSTNEVIIDKPMNVEIYEKEATRFMAIFNDDSEYQIKLSEVKI